MEGVVLYVLLVKVFVEGSQRRYIIQFTVLSYGKHMQAIRINEIAPAMHSLL